MSLINKSFQNKITGDTFKIVDVYQNVAITNNKEKIDTKLLLNNKIFIPVGEVNESFSPDRIVKSDDVVDPQRFFENQNAYNYLADTIRKIDTSNIEQDENVTVEYPSSNQYNVSNESAIVYSDPEDEVEELKRKYGATSVDTGSLKRQNDAFARIIDPEQEVQSFEAPREPIQGNQHEEIRMPKVERIEVVDPVITMFKNVKRNIEFKINLKIDDKIPRLDFIEMMEDSYEISIIEYLAEEFTNNILLDPSVIRNQIVAEIKSMIDKKNGVKPEVKIPTVKQEDREVLNIGVPEEKAVPKKAAPKKSTPKKAAKTIPPPPSPPKNRLLKEGSEPPAPNK